MDIKFRAKRKDNKKWVKWDAFGEYEIPFQIGDIVHTHVNKADIIPETLCACSGLLDEDGENIFQNDKIEDGARNVLTVRFGKFLNFDVAEKYEEYGWYMDGGAGCCFPLNQKETFKIVGNTFK